MFKQKNLLNNASNTIVNASFPNTWQANNFSNNCSSNKTENYCNTHFDAFINRIANWNLYLSCWNEEINEAKSAVYTRIETITYCEGSILPNRQRHKQTK